MKQTFRSEGRLLLVLWIFCHPCVPRALGQQPASADTLWESALKAFHENDARRAAALFGDWIDSKAKQGVRSPEAHFNLGLADWKLNHRGEAVFQVLQSAALTTSPLSIWRRIDSLGSMQREIGMRESLTDSPLLALFLMGNRNLRALIWMLGIWSLWGWLIWRRKRNSASGPYAKALLAAPALLMLFAGGLHAARAKLFHPAVLDTTEAGGVPLFRDAMDTADKKLVDLPAGALVTTGRSSMGRVEISNPIAGWVPERSLRYLDGDL